MNDLFPSSYLLDVLDRGCEDDTQVRGFQKKTYALTLYYDNNKLLLLELS